MRSPRRTHGTSRSKCPRAKQQKLSTTASARLSSSDGCCKWCSDRTSSPASCEAAGFLGFTSSKQLLVSAKQRAWMHSLNMLLYTHWRSRDSYSQMGELSFFGLAWKTKGEEPVGVVAGRGELGDHLWESILTHEKGAGENQRELLKKPGRWWWGKR